MWYRANTTRIEIDYTRSCSREYSNSPLDELLELVIKYIALDDNCSNISYQMAQVMFARMTAAPAHIAAGSATSSPTSRCWTSGCEPRRRSRVRAVRCAVWSAAMVLVVGGARDCESVKQAIRVRECGHFGRAVRQRRCSSDATSAANANTTSSYTTNTSTPAPTAACRSRGEGAAVRLWAAAQAAVGALLLACSSASNRPVRLRREFRLFPRQTPLPGAPAGAR